MARKDYASRNKKPAAKAAGLPGWAWMSIGLSVGLAVAAFVWISRPMSHALPGQRADQARVDASEIVNTPPASNQQVTAAKQQQPEPMSESRKRFTFYELLPNQEVVVPSDEPARRPNNGQTPIPDPGAMMPPPPTSDPNSPENGDNPTQRTQVASTINPSSPSTPSAPMVQTTPPRDQYLIQVASFRDQGQAEQQKAALALMGMEARIEKVTIDNRDTYYRVRIGPSADVAMLQSKLADLKAHGISALMLKAQ